MNIQDVKQSIDKFGRGNITEETVIEVKEGRIKLRNKDEFLANQVSLMDCVFEFSRNFNDSIMENLLPVLNIMIERSKTDCLLENYKN